MFKGDICCSAGSVQVCAGLEGGCEATNHAMRIIFKNDAADCILLVDATNASNCLNQHVALHNIRILCPVIATALIDTYRAEVMMFAVGGGTIRPITGQHTAAISMYAIGIVPLITQLTGLCKQAWFTNDPKIVVVLVTIPML